MCFVVLQMAKQYLQFDFTKACHQNNTCNLHGQLGVALQLEFQPSRKELKEPSAKNRKKLRAKDREKLR